MSERAVVPIPGVLDSPLVPSEMLKFSMQDITNETFVAAGYELGCRRHSLEERQPSFPVRGVIFGFNRRLLVPLAVRAFKSANPGVCAIFVVATASPVTFLSRETFAAVMGADRASEVATGAHVEIHGIRMWAGLSHGDFAGVDLLGQDFFQSLRARVTVDDVDLSLEISAPSSGS